MNVQQLKGMIDMMRNIQNPQAVEYVKQNGGDPKSACESLAKEKGFNLKDLGL